MYRGLKSFSFLCMAILLLSSFADSSDNKNYKTVKIGSQTWMAENLNDNIDGSVCYNNDNSNCDKYGRLYDWAAAMNLSSSCNSAYCRSKIGAKHRGICPAGFHIPTDAEWSALYQYTDGTNGRGVKLKTASDWTYYSGLPSGTDNFGFAALPGGFGNPNGNFYSAGFRSFWWSSSESSNTYAYGWGIHFHEKSYRDKYVKSNLFSVRCIKN